MKSQIIWLRIYWSNFYYLFRNSPLSLFQSFRTMMLTSPIVWIACDCFDYRFTTRLFSAEFLRSRPSCRVETFSPSKVFVISKYRTINDGIVLLHACRTYLTPSREILSNSVVFHFLYQYALLEVNSSIIGIWKWKIFNIKIHAKMMLKINESFVLLYFLFKIKKTTAWTKISHLNEIRISRSYI